MNVNYPRFNDEVEDSLGPVEKQERGSSGMTFLTDDYAVNAYRPVAAGHPGEVEPLHGRGRRIHERAAELGLDVPAIHESRDFCLSHTVMERIDGEPLTRMEHSQSGQLVEYLLNPDIEKPEPVIDRTREAFLKARRDGLKPFYDAPGNVLVSGETPFLIDFDLWATKDAPLITGAPSYTVVVSHDDGDRYYTEDASLLLQPGTRYERTAQVMDELEDGEERVVVMLEVTEEFRAPETHMDEFLEMVNDHDF